MPHHLPRWFLVLKYSVYSLLILNTYLFLQEEMLSLDRLFVDGLSADLIIQAFSATIDTAAWVILLLMFELETFVLPDTSIRGGVKWSLHGLRAVCSLFIVYAFYGYTMEMLYYYQVAPIAATDACSLLGSAEWSVLVDLDDFADLTADNCGTMGSELWQVGASSVVTDTASLESTRWLAWTDVVNAATWILVVVVLEFDVRMQLRGAYVGRTLLLSKVMKVILYSVLFVAAVYWGFEGDFLDFWDAFLWLFAFVFIEQNLFAWQKETAELDAVQPAVAEAPDHQR